LSQAREPLTPTPTPALKKQAPALSSHLHATRALPATTDASPLVHVSSVPSESGPVPGWCPDPTSGHTGDNVYAVNLAAPGEPTYLTAGPFNCTVCSQVNLCYARWPNSDTAEYVSNTIEVSTDGFDWTVVWESPEEALIEDGAWQAPPARHQPSGRWLGIGVHPLGLCRLRRRRCLGLLRLEYR
jgi:hypothetical protein